VSRRRGWRLRIWFWVGVGLCVVNAALLSTYRGVYAGRFQALEEEIAEVRNLRTRTTQEVARREGQVATVEATRNRVESLYREGFATERERLTDLIREVKELAGRSGLRPGSISYPEERLEQYGLVEKSLVFTVEGDYAQLRRLINELETTDTFVALESISLSEATPNLRIDLRLSTLFSDGGSTAATREAGG
jgi:Tfp pilus assembly protein PilO